MVPTGKQSVLEARSGHLAGALRRAGLDPLLFDELFTKALMQGGEEEFGFHRQPGVSFNPRIARVPLILLNEGETRDSRILAASMFVSLDVESLPSVFFAGENLMPLVHESMSLWPSSEEAQSIRAALLLDRGRHLHQMRECPELISRLLSELHESRSTLTKISRRLAAGLEHLRLRVGGGGQ